MEGRVLIRPLIFGCMVAASTLSLGSVGASDEAVAPPAAAEKRELSGAVDPAMKLMETKVEISSADPDVAALIKELRGKGIPISFIQVMERPQTLKLSKGTRSLRELLEMVTKQLPSYRFESIRGRVVVYPAAAEFSQTVTGVEIRNRPRLMAADSYVEVLRRASGKFAELVGPPVFGDSNSPVFTQSVSLTESGKVIDHLVQLLGDDPQLVFSIDPAKSGVPVLWFDRVGQL